MLRLLWAAVLGCHKSSLLRQCSEHATDTEPRTHQASEPEDEELLAVGTSAGWQQDFLGWEKGGKVVELGRGRVGIRSSVTSSAAIS